MSSLFAQGTAALQEASQGAAFAKIHYFSIEDGKSAIVRFMTEANPVPATPHLGAFITVLQHQGIPTRPRPSWLKSDDSRWPDRWGCVCRLTKAEAVPGEPLLWTLMEDKDEEHGQGCYLCSNLRDSKGKPYKPSGRGWALGCLREEVRNEAGQLVGYRDQTREVERTGPDGSTSTVTEKAIVVFNMGWKNFFSTLDGQFYGYGTVVDRDYLIRRKGSGTSTDYQIIALDPIPGHDLRDPEVFEKYRHPDYDLDKIIMEQARISYQRRWWDPTYAPPKKDDEGGSTAQAQTNQGAPAEQQVKPQTDVDPDAMAAMAAKVQGYASPAAQPVQEAPQAAPAPQEAPAPAPVQQVAPAPAQAPAGGGLANIE